MEEAPHWNTGISGAEATEGVELSFLKNYYSIYYLFLFLLAEFILIFNYVAGRHSVVQFIRTRKESLAPTTGTGRTNRSAPGRGRGGPGEPPPALTLNPRRGGGVVVVPHAHNFSAKGSSCSNSRA